MLCLLCVCFVVLFVVLVFLVLFEVVFVEESVFVLLNEVGDDCVDIVFGDCCLFIVENDVVFVRVLFEVVCGLGFKGLVSGIGVGVFVMVCDYWFMVIMFDIFLFDM